MTVIRHWFAALFESLDDMIIRCLNAAPEERQALQEQWAKLKNTSDELVEHWLQLEDKLSLLRDMLEHGTYPHGLGLQLEPFHKGQGYFKLQMFAHAARHLEEAVALYPDLLAARLYLAMTRIHLKEWTEAQRHFRLISALAEEPKLKAVAYNALGCIHAVFDQLDQACEYFQKSIETDPKFGDPKRNLERCRQGGGQLELQFGFPDLQVRA